MTSCKLGVSFTPRKLITLQSSIGTIILEKRI